MSVPPALAWRLVLVLTIAGPLCAAVDAAEQASQNVAAAARPGAAAAPASAPTARAPQPADGPAPSLAERDRLTGDWGGARDDLAGRGVTIQLELTGFFQGMLSGTGDDNFEPGARTDALVNFDLSKLGLWKGSGFRTHVEAAFGGMPLFRGGALFPMHVGTWLPMGQRETLVASSLYYTQSFGTKASLMVGKTRVHRIWKRWDDPRRHCSCLCGTA